MMTDPIADFLTRIRNGLMNRALEVVAPRSQIKEGIAGVLKEEGFIHSFETTSMDDKPQIRVKLKYGPRGENVINKMIRISRPGCRVYRGAKEIDPVQSGFGITIMSTPQGVLSDRQCRKNNVGGEVLCSIS